jgi:hypothetical protein
LISAEAGKAAPQAAGRAEGLEEAVQEDLGLTFFIARDVFPAPRGEFSEFFLARHGGVLHESRGHRNLEFIGGWPEGIA